MSDYNPSSVNPTTCDLIVFTAHPDDAELTCGGTLALAGRQGWKACVVDFTRGEMGTRGTPEIRAREAEAAAKVLGLASRVNLGLPDAGLHDSDDNRRLVVKLVRSMRPRLVIAPPLEDHHPDHAAVGEVIERSFYLCGVSKYLPELPPWRPHALLRYLGTRPALPNVVVDVTSVYETRVEAIRAHASQFHRQGSDEPATRISHPDFLAAVDGKCRYYGSLIGVAYGEAFTTVGPLPVEDLVGLFPRAPWQHPGRRG